MEHFKYDTQKYNFREIIEELFETPNIEKIHKVQDYKLFKKGTDQSTIWHRKYYDNLDKFLPTYEKFIYEVVKPIFGEEIVYQKIPTFRTQLVNNLGVFEFHKDRSYQHNKSEINFFLPFTDAYDTNTIWAESEEDKGDYKPINTLYGEVVKWYGNYLTHGSKQNKTQNTRVSVDFRIIPVSQYNEEDGSAIYSKMKFTIGDYYKVTK